MNHFSLLVNLLRWGSRLLGSVVPDAAVSFCSSDMASHGLTRDELSYKILDFTCFNTVPDQVVV